MTDDDLAEWLELKRADAEVLRFDEPMRTVEQAARALDVGEDRIVKSLVIRHEGLAAVAVVRGDRSLDLEAAARELGWPAAEMADPETARRVTGYPVGGTPPIGHSHVLTVLLDKAVEDARYVYGGGGRPEWLLKIAPMEILRLADGRVAEIAR